MNVVRIMDSDIHETGTGMGSDLQIRVLGDLQVLRNGELVELPPSKKTRALLAYLAVVQRPQRRERLCEMLWEVPDDPRGALRWSLSRIRGILNNGEQDLFTADRNTVAILPGAVETDFAQVKELLAGEPDATALRQVADAFRGFFLDDLYLPRCPDFEAWRISNVNDMELLRLDVLRRLLDALKDEPELALPYAHQLQRLVPDDAGLSKLVASLASSARRQSVSRVSATAPIAESTPPAPAPVARERTSPDRGDPAADLPALAEPTAVAPARSGPADDAADDALPPEIRFCTTRDGVNVAYSISGSGPPIVRAAHWMSHLSYDVESPVWRHWIRELSAKNTLLRYDERGNGLSQWDVDDVSFEAMVADLESIIDASGLQRVVLLGISQSCAVSVAYAVRHPERVLGLILYGGYVKGWRARGNPSEIAVREAMGTLMREGWGQDNPVFRQLFTSIFIPGASRQQMDWFNELQRKTVTPETAFRLAESFGLIDVTDLLPQVSVPTVVIHAKGDRVAPIAAGKEFAANIRNAKFVELESDNHILLEDEPAFRQFIGEVRRFVTEVTTPSPVRPAEANSKRPVSMLVADIISPLQAFDTFDPEIAAATLEPLVKAACERLDEYGGSLVDIREGTITAAFGATRAFEEHTVQACRAARAIRDAIVVAGQGSVKVRIGIDAAEALVRTAGDGSGRIEVTGPVVKAATRIANSLRRDTIALTGRARESAGGFITAVRMSRSDCPGLARDETVFELLAENKALSRWYLRARQGLTPLFGRTEEIERLTEAWREAREGRGRTVGIVGSPGVGKSRITHEFIGSRNLDGFTLVEAGAEEVDGAASFGLAKRVMLSFLGLEISQDDQIVTQTVRRRFAALGLSAALMTPILYLLDQPVPDAEWQATQGSDRAKRIREAFTTLICTAAASKPITILVEDLHWADAESCKVLDHLVRAIGDRRILILLTYRPGFQPSWIGAPGVSDIRLSPLSRDECDVLVSSLLGDDPSVETIRALICEKSDGIPLFVEEIVGSLVQSKRLSGRVGTMRMVQSTSRLDIPASIQAVIAARVDKLDPSDRSLLQIASVIGAVAPASLLQPLSNLGSGFAAAARRLTEAELLYETRSGAEPEYVFKHALILDATYASLTADRRRNLHADVLAVLERLQSVRLTDQAERLAHHATRAEDWQRATRYLLAAADRAVERSAYTAAGGFLEQAIAALEKLPQTPEHLTLGIDIRTRMRIAYMVTGDFEKAIMRLNEAQDLSRRTNDPARLAYVLLHASYVYSTYGRVDQALAVAEEARDIGIQLGDQRHIAEANLAAAQAYMMRGEAAPSLALLDAACHRLHHAMGRRPDGLPGDPVGLVPRVAGLHQGAARRHRRRRFRHRRGVAAGRADRTADRPLRRRLLREPRADRRGPDRGLPRAAGRNDCRKPRARALPVLSVAGVHPRPCAGARGQTTRGLSTLELAIEAAEQANMPHLVSYASAISAVAAAQSGDRAAREDLLDALHGARAFKDSWIEYEVLKALASTDVGEISERWLDEARAVAAAAKFGRFVEDLQEIREASAGAYPQPQMSGR
jgi:pimeloyl-ACP methyl ester carboxylesterase/DNA-binding SARP family transcriptional activator/tetratricopeptide (TPR) repeat protein